MLALGGISMIFPFIWMISTSLKSPLEVLSSQLSIIPAMKIYIEVEGRLEQVEFLLDRELQNEISSFQGDMVNTFRKDNDFPEETRQQIITFLVNSLQKFRKAIGEIFVDYRPREEVETLTAKAADHLKMSLASLVLPDQYFSFTQELFKARVQVLTDRLLAIINHSNYSTDHLEVMIVGNKQGRRKVLIVQSADLQKKRFLWRNFQDAWKAAPFSRYFLNSIFIATAVTVGQVITSALAAYAFARMEFRFKETLFMILLGTMMIPKQVILIPNYGILSFLGWINTYYALIVPFVAAVFGIYFMRQHFETLPQDLFDAASIDGCGRLRTLFQVVLPISKSVLITVSLFTFIMFWNSLLWPLVMTNTPEMRPLQVGLAVFNQESGTDWELLMAASTFSILPLLLLFFVAQKQFIEGVTRSGMKD